MRSRPLWALLLSTSVMIGGCGFWGFWRSQPVPPRPASEVVRDTEAPGTRAEEDRTPPPPQAIHGESDAIDRVVAVVNRDVITLSELQERITQYLHETKEELKPGEDRVLMEKMLQELVDYRLKIQEADREKMVVEDSEIKEQIDETMKRFRANTPEEFDAMVRAQGLTPDEVKKRFREQLLIQKVTRRKVALRVSVTEEEIEQYLAVNREKLETGLSFRARHILFKPGSRDEDAGWDAARARTEEVWAKMQAGEDFAELAKKYSQDSSAEDGGDLGQLKRGELAPEIEESILRLNPGETSGPVRTTLGYHLFKLERKESLIGEALVQAKQQIREILFRQKYQVRMDAWVEELKRRAIIEVRL